MDNICKELERSIPQFLKDELTNGQLKQFLSHVESCEECKEELTIQILTQIGTKRLEDGQAFHLGKTCTDMLSLAQRRLAKREHLEQMALVSQVAAYIGFALVVTLMVLFFG